MTETDDFVATALPAYLEAERAIHNGDPEPRKALWSRADPVTLFGAAVTRTGWDDLNTTFDWLGRSFSDCTSYDNELVAVGASGDLAYHVAIERSSVSIDGVPKSYALRVTTVFRREDGGWRIVHRHGDPYDEDRSIERGVTSSPS
jgi:ketosteroid isomerase-like protein